jgi:hypothetical protein
LLRSQFQLNFPKVWDTLNMLKKTKEHELMENIYFGEAREKWKPHKVSQLYDAALRIKIALWNSSKAIN